MLQSTLFDLPPSETRQPKPKLPTGKASSRDNGADDFVTTLFGRLETKLAAHKRAKRISSLLVKIQDAPDEIAWFEETIETLSYFLQRSRKTKLTLNDHDGLNRLVDMSDLLTDKDYEQLKRRKIWKPVPAGWIGARLGARYRAAFHRKETEHLRLLQNACRENIQEIRADAKESQAELERLRSLGPLSADIADRYRLTPEGFAKK